MLRNLRYVNYVNYVNFFKSKSTLIRPAEYYKIETIRWSVSSHIYTKLFSWFTIILAYHNYNSSSQAIDARLYNRHVFVLFVIIHYNSHSLYFSISLTLSVILLSDYYAIAFYPAISVSVDILLKTNTVMH